MVNLVYFLIIFPLLWYLLAFGYETGLAFSRLGGGRLNRGVAFVSGTWEVTHTMLVYAFTVFAISFASLLPQAASKLFLPISFFMCALMIRGSLYLYLFYSDKKVALGGFWRLVFAVAHLASWLAVAVGSYRMVNLIHKTNFTPSTNALGEIAIGFVLAVVICAVPLLQIYRRQKNI